MTRDPRGIVDRRKGRMCRRTYGIPVIDSRESATLSVHFERRATRPHPPRDPAIEESGFRLRNGTRRIRDIGIRQEPSAATNVSSVAHDFGSSERCDGVAAVSAPCYRTSTANSETIIQEEQPMLLPKGDCLRRSERKKRDRKSLFALQILIHPLLRLSD